MSQVCLFLALLTLCCCTKVSSTNSLDLVKEKWSSYKDQCLEFINTTPPATGLVCNRTFDLYACWPDGLPGTTVNVSCPWFLPWYRKVQRGLVYRICNEDGQWAHKNTTECEDDPGEQQYGRILNQLWIMYTVGYSLSLGALLLALGILIAFRKLHCMRNNIHMNLFASFILRAVSILVKDALLTLTLDPRSSSDARTHTWANVPAVMWCRGAVVMMQYSIMANSYWLLVEGLYLHALLAVSFFSERKYFWWYILIGWGAPTIFISAWVIMKAYLNDPGCWEIIDDSRWWIIKTPILVTILVNFFLFICIIRILRQKMNCPDIGRKESNQYSRLAKSTLLLIPLFGINYIIFAFIPDHINPQLRMVFDLILGSFQGFVVAVLYCFLNGEVQSEIKRKWRRWMLQRFLGSDMKYQQPSNGNNFSTQITMLTKCSPSTHRASACQEHFSAI